MKRLMLFNKTVQLVMSVAGRGGGEVGRRV